MEFLYAIFETDKKKYLYDTITNQIFTISDALFKYHSVIFSALCDENELSGLESHKDYDTIIHTLKNVKEIVSAGLMKANGLKKVDYKFNIHDYLESLGNSLHRMILDITEECNLRCKYCSYSGHYPFRRSHSKSSMTLDTAFKAVDFFYSRTEKSPIIRIDFYGGEPLMEFDKIVKIVDYSESMFKGTDKIRSYEFTTNGTLLNEEVIDWLSRLLKRDKNISSRVAVTLNGPEELHNSYRIYKNGRGSHGKIIKNLMRFAEKYPHIFEKVVVFQADYLSQKEILSIMNFFNTHPVFGKSQITANSVEFNNCDEYIKELSSLYKSKEENPPFQEIKNFYTEDLMENKKGKNFIKLFLGGPLLNIHYRNMRHLDENISFSGMCRPLLTRFFVKTDGSIHICERMDDVGNFGSIYKEFDTNKVCGFLSFVKNKIEKKCLSCFALRFCTLCGEHLVNRDGYDEEKHFTMCNNIRTGLIRNLKLYCELREFNVNIFDKIDKNDYEKI